MNSTWLLFAQLIANIGSAVMTSEGKDPKSLGYLQLATQLMAAGRATDAALTELKARYEAAIANDTPVTVEEILAQADEIAALSDAIQSA